ncbi:MAG: BrnT family toxin [Deltaproteobacteria bacterium]|nr:MAG: BrnT family toxin [Deltaproteobacteria bacterium]
MLIEKISGLLGFDWDQWNREKSEKKHGVTSIECEQVFFNKPLIIVHDEKHSKDEIRYFSLGKTHGKRGLAVIFTLRNKKIRVISARPMSRQERKVYEKEENS